MSEYEMRKAQEIEAERLAVETIQEFGRLHGEELRMLWSRGDGDGGGLLCMLADAAGVTRRPFVRPAAQQVKAVIGAALRTQVFERDAYRCVTCGGHKDLCCDHVHPESKGGATTLGNLQTMCRSCNSKKGARV